MNRKPIYFISALLLCAGIIFAFKFDDAKRTNRKIISTKDAPQPIGPYSQGILSGNTLYCAGQVGINPITNKLDSTGIAGETEQILKNLKAVLSAGGMEFTDVVKTTIYLKNVKDFSKVNEVYGKYFLSNPPARETVGIADLPKGANIEISMIAAK